MDGSNNTEILQEFQEFQKGQGLLQSLVRAAKHTGAPLSARIRIFFAVD